jgi:hypothetical protein
VRLYVLSDHRTALNTADRGLSVTWAGRVADHVVGSDLAKVAADGPGYLTRFDGRLEPEAITDDIHFAAATADTTVSPAPRIGGGARKTNNGDTAVFIGVGVGVVLVGMLIWFALGRRRSFGG